ncbi:glycosyltransferase [Ciceribacter sp. L1K23]|uniref:glycosyltransferase family 4 protein n=1 Tax=Ciceribacter sp. L1K23 TaxID=2820276 RepID=UPI001B82A7FB|nr:glycosyltransferase family 4 protein [Ciceribacter sp. L1K23]MBR0555756.1 glycosyltransferase [Ciceribacter sp. L1K23]
MKRILFVTRTNPIRVTAGNQQRTDQSIKALVSLGYKVQVMMLVGPNASKDKLQKAFLRKYPQCKLRLVQQRSGRDLVALGKWRAGLRQYLLETLDRLTLRTWMITNEHECPRALRVAIDKELRSGRYAAYFSNYLKVTPLNGVRFAGPKLCDTHDVQSERIWNNLRRDEPSALMRRLKYQVHRWSERRCLRNFDALLAISSQDVERLASIGGAACPELVCAPASFPDPGVDIHTHKDADIGFVGTSSRPNVDGLLWFMSEVLPVVLERHPDLRFRIIGKSGLDPAVVDAAAAFTGNIELKGLVDDLAAEYPKVKIWIAPMRFGTGMKIKVVEALSMKAAIVGTSLAFTGIDVADGTSAMVADDAMEFADKIGRLLDHEALRARMSAAAFDVFKAGHSFEAYRDTLSRVLSQA